MCNYFVERAHAFFMCLAKTEVFNDVYELSKGRSTESTEAENKVLPPQNKHDEGGALSRLPRASLLLRDEQEAAPYLLVQVAAQSAP